MTKRGVKFLIHATFKLLFKKTFKNEAFKLAIVKPEVLCFF